MELAIAERGVQTRRALERSDVPPEVSTNVRVERVIRARRDAIVASPHEFVAVTKPHGFDRRHRIGELAQLVAVLVAKPQESALPWVTGSSRTRSKDEPGSGPRTRRVPQGPAAGFPRYW